MLLFLLCQFSPESLYLILQIVNVLVFLLDQLLVVLQLVVCPQLNHILFYFCFEVLGSIGVFEGVQSVFVVVA